jgi:predicted nucleic acid-binding protein
VIARAIAGGSVVVLPTIVLAETTTGFGPRDAPVNPVVKACLVEDLDERIARAATALRFRVPASGVADAVVIATADAYPGSKVLTGDPRDMRALASIRGLTAVIRT